MSRIFDALQRSGVEQTGVAFPDTMSVANHVFETPLQEQTVADGTEQFPSVQVSIAATARLVFFTEPESLAAEKLRLLGVRLRQLQQNRTLSTLPVSYTHLTLPTIYSV